MSDINHEIFDLKKRVKKTGESNCFFAQKFRS